MAASTGTGYPIVVTRPSQPSDFDEVGADGDADPSPLRRLILSQEAAPGGAAVALWTDASLEAVEGDPFTLDGYVVQSAFGLAERRPWVPAADAAVDVVHAVSMLGLAAVSPRHRRVALVSAGCALAFATLDLTEEER